MGRTALTAASFCVFLTLETSTFFDAVALRATGFAAAFFVLAVTFCLVAVFFAATLRAADFVTGLATALAALTRVVRTARQRARVRAEAEPAGAAAS